MKISGYTTAEIIARLKSPVTRVYISQEAKREGWPVVAKIGTANIYDPLVVEAWLQAKTRNAIQEKLQGKRMPHLIKTDHLDFDCPECGCLALPRWPSTPDEEIAWLAGELALPWRCENGHRGNEAGVHC